MRQKKKEKQDAKNEAEHEEPMVTDDPVVKYTIYFNIFECGKNILNKLDAPCGRACMTNQRDEYYMELLRTVTDFNDHNGAPFSNENIKYAIHRVIVEEKVDDHKVTVDTFIQKTVIPNTQGDN